MPSYSNDEKLLSAPIEKKTCRSHKNAYENVLASKTTICFSGKLYYHSPTDCMALTL